MMKKFTTLFALLLISIGSAYGQASPWGTGLINTQSLTALAGSPGVTAHTGVYYDLNGYLASYDFNIYIPNSYDGTKPYGLIAFIDAGNQGAFSSNWIPVLEEKNLILIAGNNIGNSVAVKIRTGVVLAGTFKLEELLNIDTARIYTSGTSGGARSATELMFAFPEKFHGMAPNCGSGYLRQVTQDYETYQPNSHYEYTYPFTTSQLAYVQSFDRRYAMMTSYDDFREGDIMNIYHNGMELDFFKAKILETTGGHCATTTAQFRDAINFVEHEHIDVIRDSFSGAPVVGNGFKMNSATITGGQLELDHNMNGAASAYAKNTLKWNDDKGAILRTSIMLDSASYNSNSFFNLGLVDFKNPNVYNQTVGASLLAGTPNIITSVVFNGAQPTVYVLAENPAQSIANDTIFSGQFTDWYVSSPLKIKYHIWNQELRIEFSNHFGTNKVGGSNVKLLDDFRSVRFRTTNTYWDTTDFDKGSMLTLVSGKLNTQMNSSALKVDYMEVVSADISGMTPLSTNDLGKSLLGQLKVFPNPSKGVFNVTSKSVHRIDFLIYNTIGKIVGRHTHNGLRSIVDVTNLSTGIYFMKVQDAKEAIRLVVE